MEIDLLGGETLIQKNGDQLAKFYYCDCCGDFLAVGCEINGELRGSVNSKFVGKASQLGEPISIQPRLLNAQEKLDRWSKLWGLLNGV